MPDAGSGGDARSIGDAARPTIGPTSRRLERLDRLGTYRVCFEVASGGMATVFLARSRARVGRDRFVALKVVHPHLARDPVFVEMFADEARLASMIHHPNVCRVLDFDRDAPDPYLAMEYLSGENLASLFGRYADSRARMGREELERHAARVARVMADACAGLHAAHELRDEDGERLDVVHRDVSPENLFLTFEGVTKIVDFGVAQASRQHHRTSTGFVKGKLAYLQPEAIRSEPLDRRADVWGLGVTMWELLTGERLFRREGDLDTLRAIEEQRIVPPSEARPGLPSMFDAIVLRALERRPDARFPTTREMGRELFGALAANGPIPDTVDLAEWMDALFPGGRGRAKELLDLATRIAEDDAEVDERDERLEREPTRRRSILPVAPPPMPAEWPIPSRRTDPPPRRRRYAAAFAALLGAGVGALGAWLVVAPITLGAIGAAQPPRSGPVADAVEAPTYRPTAELLVGSGPSGAAAHVGVSRTWVDEVRTAEIRDGRVSVEIDEGTREIVLSFRRPSAGATGTPPPGAH